jgi:DNA-binding response OmpR family regulator
VAPPHRLADLDRHLPSGWGVVHRTDLPAGGRDPDIVVLDDPLPRTVTAACLRHPAAAIVAVLTPYSDHQDVVDVLEAGADACVRSGTTTVVAAHVEACQRRQAA